MRHRANLAIVFFCLLLPLTGCKQKINRSDSAFGGMSIDSVERCAQDSLFSNTRYSRSLLRHAMADAPDSLSYYYLCHFIPNLILLRQTLIQSCITIGL